MSIQIRNKYTVLATAGLLTLMLASLPARAHHDGDIVAPLITGFTLGALVNYGHSSRHYYHYQHQRLGHYREPSGHGSSHSSGHGSYDYYSQKRRHSSSNGDPLKPWCKH